jgi:hypothetical protein
MHVENNPTRRSTTMKKPTTRIVRAGAAAVVSVTVVCTMFTATAHAAPPGAEPSTSRKVNEYEGQHRKVNEYEGQHRKVNEYEGQHVNEYEGQ